MREARPPAVALLGGAGVCLRRGGGLYGDSNGGDDGDASRRRMPDSRQTPSTTGRRQESFSWDECSTGWAAGEGDSVLRIKRGTGAQPLSGSPQNSVNSLYDDESGCFSPIESQALFF